MNKPNGGTPLGGVLYTSSAYVLWGFLPLYWKALGSVPAFEILAHRIWWSFVFTMAIIFFQKQKLHLFVYRLKFFYHYKKEFLFILIASLAISANWVIFIWAVNHGKVIEASLGMYMIPLISILLGVILLRDKCGLGQSISFLIALLGVALLVVRYGQIPWVALSLALSSGVYSYAKKCIRLDALVAMGYETLIGTPAALVYLLMLQIKGTASFGTDAYPIAILLIGAGIVTALPLIWFAEGVKRLSLSTVGVIQYITPSIAFLIGWLIFKESISLVQWFSLILLWVSITIYLFSSSHADAKEKRLFQ
ncbi:EamA family transporter RarD [Sporolactobacillus spathodeae]|uniref:Chloramphenicol-sensitive protein RarD n=1 Tax=Sporolactobacillus spathodeae TaxID=1465502 RepID=A0ABS2Q7V5_9BACL|nr:EamA family transporter RarD [Sporolactobacillus spathodeae]MBM7657249.1 chloramphenicol-sensitive protein RarD [Sporolactobacillus spathodeae]